MYWIQAYWPLISAVVVAAGAIVTQWEKIKKHLPAITVEKTDTPEPVSNSGDGTGKTDPKFTEKHDLLDHYLGLYEACPDVLKPDLEKVGSAILVCNSKRPGPVAPLPDITA